MLIASMFAAAALAKLQPAVEADMRCAVAMLYAAGMASEQKDEEMVTAYAAGAAFFAGKLSVSAPGVDLKAHLNRLADSPDFTSKINEEVSRCSQEAGDGMGRLSR